MPDAELPQMPAADLAQRLDGGEHVQVLDIRSPERVAHGRVAFGATLGFRALAASEMYRLPSLAPLGLERTAPVAVICGHGNSSQRATRFLRERGFEAYSVTGGMAAWETVYLVRRLAPTAALLADLDATPAAVIDTHIHADYLSGARAAAVRWQVPYFLHPDDARSPYDDAPGRLAYQPMTDGDTIAFGRAALRVAHVPGHTLGSVALLADDTLALTGDFLFVRSVGRPDLGGRRDAWARLLWRSLERARHEWPGDLVVLPAHYAGEWERRADRSVAARFDVIAATNEAAALQEERAFLAWVADHTATPPESYRSIKLANLGLAEISEAEAEVLEFGPNQCAVG